MSDAWLIGPILVKEIWLLSILSGVIANIILIIAFKLKNIAKAMRSKLWDALILFLIVWKFSYVLFSPIPFIKNPGNALFFTGGSKGILLGLAAAAVYLFWHSRKSGTNLYFELGMITFLSSVGTYELLEYIWIQPSYPLLLETGLALLLLLYWFKVFDQEGEPKWGFLLTWYCIGELAISFLKPRIEWLLGFSFYQCVLIVVILLIVIGSEFVDKFSADK